MLKLCIWMNIPSHYQSAFFRALNDHDGVELHVVYLNAPSQDRAAEGWKQGHDAAVYESFADKESSAEDLVETVSDWQDRTHVISGNFSKELLNFFCAKGVKWCHWSEMPGIRLAELLGYRMNLFRMLYPLMLGFKRNEGRRIRKHATGTFGQGKLARRAFRLMGVPDRMISDLYYTPAGLTEAGPCEQMIEHARGRKIFLSTGALCCRKGIDVLLKAYAGLKTNDWCLVLCGLDRSGGEYHVLAKKLGIDAQVLFLGAYPADRIAEVYSAADVCVLASRFDGWGAVLNEAASLGLPLIGTDLCGASWHLIDQGRNGFRVGTGSVKSLRQAMEVYLERPDKLESHGEVSRNRFCEMFTAESNAARLVTALKKWKGV